MPIDSALNRLSNYAMKFVLGRWLVGKIEPIISVANTADEKIVVVKTTIRNLNHWSHLLLIEAILRQIFRS